jgi:hypothetical protein
MFRNLSAPVVLIIIAGCMTFSAVVTYVVAVPHMPEAVQQFKCPPESTRNDFFSKPPSTVVGDEPSYGPSGVVPPASTR